MDKVQEDELDAWGPWVNMHFTNVLNGEYSLEDAVEDIKSFRNEKYYTGTEEKYEEII